MKDTPENRYKILVLLQHNEKTHETVKNQIYRCLDRMFFKRGKIYKLNTGKYIEIQDIWVYPYARKLKDSDIHYSVKNVYFTDTETLKSDIYDIRLNKLKNLNPELTDIVVTKYELYVNNS